jgi:hypothetical protein
MSIAGNPGSEDRKKFVAMCVFGAIVIGYLYYAFFRDPTPTAPPPVIVTAPVSAPRPVLGDEPSEGSTAKISSGSGANGSAAKFVGTTSAALDPTLHMDAMLVTESVVYDGTGRNIFSPMSAPAVVIPKPVTPARPVQIAVIAPPTTPARPPTCPPQCPPIDLKFVGTVEAPPGSGIRQAFVLHGEDVSLASAGDIVLRRYRIISIAANSLQVEDMPNHNTQSLPLLAN